MHCIIIYLRVPNQLLLGFAALKHTALIQFTLGIDATARAGATYATNPSSSISWRRERTLVDMMTSGSTNHVISTSTTSLNTFNLKILPYLRVFTTHPLCPNKLQCAYLASRKAS